MVLQTKNRPCRPGGSEGSSYVRTLILDGLSKRRIFEKIMHYMVPLSMGPGITHALR